MSEWKEYCLKEITTKIGSGATPKGGKESYYEEGISLIRSQNVLDFEFSINGLAFIDKEQADQLKNVVVNENDILLNITGDSVARVCKVPKKILPARVNQHVAIIRTKENIADSNFILYYLLNPTVKKQLLQIASDGATRNALTKTHIENLHLKIPSLSEQKRIADVLSCLDAKIENLRKQNNTLEQIAQTLFKHWFIDFEFPNTDGKPYKSSGGEMQSSVLGDIPKGWRVGKLGDVADISIGRTPPRNEPDWFSTNPKDVKWISIRDMGNCGIYIFDTSEYLTQEAVEKFNIPIIPKNTVIVSFKLTVGRLAITTEKMLSNEAIAHIKLIDDLLNAEYVYLFLKKYNFDELGNTSSIATAVNSKSIKSIFILLPCSEVINYFYQKVSLIFKKIRLNSQQIQTLTKIRDGLLPKLMSGQIRIEE